MTATVRSARRRLRRPTPQELLGAGIGLVAAAAVLGGLIWWVVNRFYAGDTLTYWLAGQRVLVGHELYWMGPDDPWLIEIRPYGLLSPPLVAVPWLLLAGAPGIAGMTTWWFTMAFFALWAEAVILLGTRGWGGLAVLPLVPSITLLIGVGNVDALVLAGVVATSMLAFAGREIGAGVIVGFLFSLKLTPAVLILWLVATRRWRALAAALGTTVICAAVVAIVLGPSIFVDYVRVMVGGTASGRSLNLLIGLGFMLAVVILGRRHERLAFAVAVAAIPFASPVAAGHSWAMLTASLSPWARWYPGQRATPGPDLASREPQSVA